MTLNSTPLLLHSHLRKDNVREGQLSVQDANWLSKVAVDACLDLFLDCVFALSPQRINEISLVDSYFQADFSQAVDVHHVFRKSTILKSDAVKLLLNPVFNQNHWTVH